MMKIALIALLMAPLIGALINGLRWKQTDLKLAGFIGVTSCFISFLSAIYLFIFILAQEKASFFISFSEWLHIYSFKVSFSFLVDPLSVLMLLLITGVGFLIHLFSVYYMSDDKGPAKYFSYLNLFVFSMLVLVSADNLFLMFLGWEGVGLCSYLLIGFWFTDKQKAAAGSTGRRSSSSRHTRRRSARSACRRCRSTARSTSWCRCRRRRSSTTCWRGPRARSS